MATTLAKSLTRSCLTSFLIDYSLLYRHSSDTYLWYTLRSCLSSPAEIVSTALPLLSLTGEQVVLSPLHQILELSRRFHHAASSACQVIYYLYFSSSEVFLRVQHALLDVSSRLEHGPLILLLIHAIVLPHRNRRNRQHKHRRSSNSAVSLTLSPRIVDRRTRRTPHGVRHLRQIPTQIDRLPIRRRLGWEGALQCSGEGVAVDSSSDGCADCTTNGRG
jgi:hypothetical protein